MRSTSIFYDGTQALRVYHSAANKQLIIACDLLLFIAFYWRNQRSRLLLLLTVQNGTNVFCFVFLLSKVRISKIQ